MSYEVPKQRTEYWCSSCGLKQWRDARVKHRVGGVVCTGQVTKAEYMLVHETVIPNHGQVDD